MKLRWWRKCPNAEGIKEAEAAVEREKQAGEAVEAKRPIAEQVAAERAQHYRENNFSRLIEDSMHLRRGSR